MLYPNVLCLSDDKELVKPSVCYGNAEQHQAAQLQQINK